VSFIYKLKKSHIRSTFCLGLDGVCGARDGLKGGKGEPGYPGEAGK
jgi:hypothetical protein